MPPSGKGRNALDDNRPDPVSTKERLNNYVNHSGRIKKPTPHAGNASAAAKDQLATNATTHGASAASGTQEAIGLTWETEDVRLLNNYRNAYRLDVASSFHSPLNAALLSGPGIGRLSPTMARKKEKRKVHKDQLALAVRKHFNGLAVNETDVIVEFLYKTKTQDRNFKLRFPPGKKV